MTEHLSEEEQIEALKKWWKENGTAILVGIVIGVGGIIGYWKWNEYKETRALEASAAYDKFVSEVEHKSAETTKLYGELKDKYDGTSYAALAALKMAAIDITKGETQKAIEQLKWAVENPGHDVIAHIARVRLTKLLVAENKLDEAEKLLKDVKEPAFDAQYAAIRGDIQNKRGNIEQARADYEIALASDTFTGKQREYIQMKLDNLGVAELSAKAKEVKE
ncbi:MAG: tetratricopeptide repeat protein [Thioalkalispiraceae bacterium]|jgi:predicted negative regulator of RcsB-dependent stress response